MGTFNGHLVNFGPPGALNPGKNKPKTTDRLKQAGLPAGSSRQANKKLKRRRLKHEIRV